MIAAAILACAAVLVHPKTMDAVVQVESRGDPIAINVNGLGRQHPHSAAEAAAIAHRYIALGYSVDIGLAQINSRNLPALGLTVEQVLDPCTNVRAGGTILAADYTRAAGRFGAGQGALLAALSAYNTGSFERGFANGYVARYDALAGDEFRQIVAHSGKSCPGGPSNAEICHEMTKSAADPYAADSAVYVGVQMNVPVS